MATQALLIDIGKETLSAVVFATRSTGPAGFVSVKLNSIEGLSAALTELTAALEEKGLLKGPPGSETKVYVSIHPAYMHMRVLDMPFSDRKKIQEILAFELIGAFSVDVSEVIYDHVPLLSGHGKNKVLAVALEKRFIRGLLETLGSKGLDPVWVGPALFYAPRLVKEEGGAGIRTALVTGDFMSVSLDTAPIFMSPLGVAGGLEMCVSYLRAEGVAVEKVFYLDRDPEEIKAVFPGAASISEFTQPGGLPGKGFALYALWSLVVEGEIKDAVNFRQAEFSCTRESDLSKKRFRVTAVFMALLLTLFAGDYYLRFKTLAVELGAYESALERSYSELFPGERPPADPLYGLNVKVNELDKEALVLKGAVGPLEAMRVVAAAAKDAGTGIRINEFRIAGGKVQLRGDAGSFDEADRFKVVLSKAALFKGVTLSDVKSGPSGGAVFSLTIETK